MSGDIIQLNPEAFQTELKGLVKNSIDNDAMSHELSAPGSVFPGKGSFLADTNYATNNAAP